MKAVFILNITRRNPTTYHRRPGDIVNPSNLQKFLIIIPVSIFCMTAEIAIYNKSAIALAADSAVTIGDAKKIYNSANKLFPLSKYYPVGIMVYANGELMGVPWETIIKVYRKQLGSNRFDTLKQYADDFLRFLGSSQNVLFPEKRTKKFLEDHLFTVAHSYFEYLSKERSWDKERLAVEGLTITEELLYKLMQSRIEKELKEWREYDSSSLIKIDQLRKWIPNYAAKVFAAGERALPVALAESEKDKLIEIVLLAAAKSWPYSGVVVAGFGEQDVFPCYGEYLIYARVNSELIHEQGKNKLDGDEPRAAVVPFADRNVVDRFLTGIDPEYEDTIKQYISELVKNYPETILTGVPTLDEEARRALAESFKGKSDELIQDFGEMMKKFERASFVNPIVSNLHNLPKDELASMAESLVNITLFHKRISLAEFETVGGPIDVAVISKGDGLIWIKRKHYFQQELNRHYLENYFRKDTMFVKEEDTK
jgi:hypothetical protein